jgi:hypothetical protein
MFLWRIASHLLPTKDNLDKFLHFEDRYCPLCELEQESIIHLFLHCTVAKALWFGSSRGIKSESLPICHGANLVSYILNPLVLFLSNIEDTGEIFFIWGFNSGWDLKVVESSCFRKKGSSIEDLLRILSTSFMEH